ncbi:Stigma-specific protein, Stig1 [Musa troglodytarum]|nr:Stigma-specific protein, Stig1 [Musa troglodytarum]
MCCGGGCVNVFYDPNNCGFCGNRCKPGGFCRYGMCDYAS